MRVSRVAGLIVAATAVGFVVGLFKAESMHWSNGAHDVCFALYEAQFVLRLVDSAQRAALLEALLASPELPPEAKKVTEYAKRGDCR